MDESSEGVELSLEASNRSEVGVCKPSQPVIRLSCEDSLIIDDTTKEGIWFGMYSDFPNKAPFSHYFSFQQESSCSIAATEQDQRYTVVMRNCRVYEVYEVYKVEHFRQIATALIRGREIVDTHD